MSRQNRRNVLKAMGGVSFVPIASAQAQTPPVPDANSGSQPPPPAAPQPARRKSPPPPNSAAKPVQPAAATANKVNHPDSVKADAVKSTAEFNQFVTQADKVAKTLNERQSLLGTITKTRLETAFKLRTSTASYADVRCDVLASEAASLISRCLNIRKDWEGVYESSYAFLSDLDRFDRLDAIFRLQEANGYYDLDLAISQGELDSNSQFVSSLSFASSLVEDLLNSTQANQSDQYGWIQLLGWLSHISGYGSSGNATARVVWNGVEDTVINYCYKAAVAQGDVQLASLISQLSSDVETRRAQIAALSAKSSSLQSKATWDAKNQNFRRLQTDAMRAIYAERHRLIVEPNGPLNFNERLANLQTDFDTTFSDALGRFTAIASGFGTVFGITTPIPAAISSLIVSGGAPAPSDSILDLAQQWLDSIGSQYARLMQTEQVYSVSVSIKSLLTSDQWNDLASQKTVKFQVTEKAFPDQYNVRLRALALSTVGVYGESCSTTIKVPAKSYYIHHDGKKYVCAQSYVRPIRYARVASIDRPGPAGRFGLNAIHNCSPFGEWTLTLTQNNAGFGAFLVGLSDLFLELIVAGQ